MQREFELIWDQLQALKKEFYCLPLNYALLLLVNGLEEQSRIE